MKQLKMTQIEVGSISGIDEKKGTPYSIPMVYGLDEGGKVYSYDLGRKAWILLEMNEWTMEEEKEFQQRDKESQEVQKLRVVGK